MENVSTPASLAFNSLNTSGRQCRLHELLFQVRDIALSSSTLCSVIEACARFGSPIPSKLAGFVVVGRHDDRKFLDSLTHQLEEIVLHRVFSFKHRVSLRHISPSQRDVDTPNAWYDFGGGMPSMQELVLGFGSETSKTSCAAAPFCLKGIVGNEVMFSVLSPHAGLWLAVAGELEHLPTLTKEG
ncbi:hypothetical protein EI94DRAFT_1800858 [Lactarius quietus]|nr:hypothetical protein EI94DRAFT_1800858 [Lactarius quietus]